MSNVCFLAEENLQQLHEIHDCIQRMRDLTLGTLGYNIRASNAPQRLTSSCPSLCLASAELVSRSGNHHHHDTGSDPDLLLGNCSTNSSPTHFPSTGGHAYSQQAQGIDRRRSWTGDLEDLEESRRGRRRYSGQNHLQAQNMVNIARYLLKPGHGSDSISVSSCFDATDFDATHEYFCCLSIIKNENIEVISCVCVASKSELIEIISVSNARSKSHSYLLHGDGMVLVACHMHCVSLPKPSLNTA